MAKKCTIWDKVSGAYIGTVELYPKEINELRKEFKVMEGVK